MQDMCKRAAAKLGILWPAVGGKVAKSCFDGKKEQKTRKMGKRVWLVFPELLDEIVVTWRV